jgi:hypothetical protein
MTLSALIALLEESKEGSRELDDAVWAATQGMEFRWREGKRPEWFVKECYCDDYPAHKLGASHWRSFGPGAGGPHYTTSLDAALSLVPEGCAWDARFLPCKDGDVHEARVNFDFPSHAATVPLALVIAALKARIGSSPTDKAREERNG